MELYLAFLKLIIHLRCCLGFLFYGQKNKVCLKMWDNLLN